MRRLFSTFARGATGLGLLLLRVVAGGALVIHGATAMAAKSASLSIALDVLSAVAGASLLLGLWTPVVGALVAIYAALLAFLDLANRGLWILLATQAAALALLGPGAFSVDARLFGWRRVEILNGNGDDNGRGHSNGHRNGNVDASDGPNGSGPQKRPESPPF